jgi:hypothetical protein
MKMRKSKSQAARAKKLLADNPTISVDEASKILKVKRPRIYVLMSSARKEIRETRKKSHPAPPPEVITMSEAVDMIADVVNNPPHYTVGGIQTIDFIDAKGLNYNLGNAVKYISRAALKGDAKTDLSKARWYLEREINKL